jgi:dienelactone hydrolase
LQNLLSNRIILTGYCFFFILSLLILIEPESLTAQIVRKSKINFKASDGLLVTADIYQSWKSNPYIILFPQEQSCRGEFDSIASRFIKMNYNCMAVDLRSGDNFRFVKNETAIRAREGRYAYSLTAASKDIEAAIDYLYQSTGNKISLFGSASSASLALIVGRDNEHVKAIVAFSPGEYFSPEYDLKSVLANYPKPVFIACSHDEYFYLSGIKDFKGPDKILFKPSSREEIRGTNALLKENPARDEYWLSLLIFFKSLQ